MSIDKRRLVPGPAKVNLAGAGDGGDERRLGSAADATHLVEGTIEGFGHVLAGHVAGGKDELADLMNFQCAFFEQVVPDALVASQQDPAFRANHGQPNFIESSGREVGQVTLEANAELGENFEDRVSVAEIFVEVKNELVRRRRGEGVRAPSGWLLRSPAACGHILRQALRSIPGR